MDSPTHFEFCRGVGARRDLFSSIVLLVLDGTIFLSLYDFCFCFHSSCWCSTGPYFFLDLISVFAFVRPVGARRDLFSSIVLLVLDRTMFLSRSDLFCFV